MRDKPSTIISKRRAELGLSQQAAASRAELSISGWQLIERGTVENPTLDTARAIASALDLKMADIWDWAK